MTRRAELLRRHRRVADGSVAFDRCVIGSKIGGLGRMTTGNATATTSDGRLSDADRARVAELKWFHAIDFGGFASSGRFKPGTPQNITLYGISEYLAALDLSHTCVLDVGTCDGIVAYGAHRLGSQAVVAVDWLREPTFEFASDRLGLADKIEYLPGHQISALKTLFGQRRFDCIVCAGVIYHMLYLMQAFAELRPLMNDDGILMMETPFEDRRDDAVLIFNGVDIVVNEPYIYFVPARAALTGMAALSGFKVLSEPVLKAPRRITLLLQVVDRAALIEDDATPPFVKQMLKRDTCDDVFRFQDLERSPGSPAMIRFKEAPPVAEREIDAYTEVVTFPYHPARDVPVVGSTRFETEHGNSLTL